MTSNSPDELLDRVRTYVADHAGELHADLDAWLRIPSISAAPEHATDVTRSAEWLSHRLVALGFPVVETWATSLHPSVFAEWPCGGPDAPTVLLYGHHDVQPVDPLESWETPPFEPTVVGDELRARGAIDDKGQVLFHLLGLAAHLAVTGRDAPRVNLKVLVEGEEEIGSVNFPTLLKERKDRLSCDVVVVSDTSMHSRDVPSMCVGMRGLVYAQVDLHGPDIDLHSGSFGGAVPNPATVLARIFGTLHDDQGHVTLDGFYDRVVPLSDRERELIERLPFDESEWLSAVAKSRAAVGESGFTTYERLWARPTAEVHGMSAGYTGAGQKTIVPTDASGKVSFRLVFDQRPAEVEVAFRTHVLRHTPDGIEATIQFFGDGVKACLTPLDHPALQAATRAMGRAFGSEVLYTREGGSGPEADLAEILEAPVIFLGVGLPDDRIHAPNERVIVPLLETGAVAAALLWDELAESGVSA